MGPFYRYQLSIQIRILKQVQANEARRQADTAALIRVLLGQHQDSTIKDAHLLDALDIFEPPAEQQSATPIAARSTETLHLDIPDRPQSQVGPQPHVEGLPHVHAQTQVFTLPDDVSTPTQSFPINWATTLSHIHSPTQCRALISVLQSRQNASDRTHDALDLQNVLKTALRKGNDVEILGLLQIGRDEIPEAIKTLQRAYEREIERDEIEKEGSDGTPAGSALGLSAENSPALASASASIGAGASTIAATNKDGWTNTVRTFESMDSIESAVSTPATVDSYTSYTSTSSSTRRPRDTLDREFIEGGIEALKRLSKTRVDVPSWTITR
jgi:abelson tyrosine-protein kinase 1